MDRFGEMRVFLRVAETRSFRRAAEVLGLPRSTVTDAIKRMEVRLGVRLLDRTTRVAAPTLDGEAWHRRCFSILAKMKDAEAAFGGTEATVIRESARAAGVEKSAHGLRKSRATVLAEAGATTHQIGAWTGRESLKEVEHYTRRAGRRAAVMGLEQERKGGNASKLCGNTS